MCSEKSYFMLVKTISRGQSHPGHIYIYIYIYYLSMHMTTCLSLFVFPCLFDQNLSTTHCFPSMSPSIYFCLSVSFCLLTCLDVSMCLRRHYRLCLSVFSCFRWSDHMSVSISLGHLSFSSVSLSAWSPILSLPLCLWLININIYLCFCVSDWSTLISYLCLYINVDQSETQRQR